MRYPAGYTGNSRLGTMLLWIGCICQFLWTFAWPSLSPLFTRGDFAPIFIYSALALAGIALILLSRSERSASAKRRTQPDRPELAAPRHLGPQENAEGGGCIITAVGPFTSLQSALGPLFESSGLKLESAETASIALQKISAQPRSDVPNILILPWVRTGVTPYFIRAIKSDRTLGAMSIIVWGAGIPAPQIQSLYQAGVTCVIPSELNEATCTALLRFCASVGTQPSESRV
jgi:hypothetical protein